MARAAASESGHNFLSVRGAELLNMYVGESERAIRDLFSKARSVSPSIIFFDEIDSIGARRDSAGHTGLNVLTTLLTELDGISELKDVFILAATNRPDALDPALTRAGRLDTLLVVGPPDPAARLDILKKTLAPMDVAEALQLDHLVERTHQFSGSELVSLCQRAGQAALRQAIKAKKAKESVQVQINQEHFDDALLRVHTVITDEMLESYDAFANSVKSSSERTSAAAAL